MQTKSKFFAAMLCAVSSVAFGATDAPLDEIVVTATRLEQPLSQSLASTTVITAEDLRNSLAPDVPTILKSVAGVEFSQAGGIGQQSSLFMRGTNSNQVLVLVDGVRIDSATTGSTPLDQLMIDQIDHIEVVRGNVSSLYGSSAIGGVVQIFTRRGSGEPAFNASAGAGSQNTLRASAGFGGKSGATDYNVQVSRFRTDGIPAINSAIMPTVNPGKDGYDNNSVSANVHHAFNADHSLSAFAFQSQGNAQYANPYASFTTDVYTTTSTISKFSLASEDRLNEIWTSKLQWTKGVDDSKNYLNGQADLFDGYHFETTNRQLTWQNTLLLDAHNSILLAAENLKQQVASDTLYTSTERTVNSLFGGYTGTFGAHQVQVNLRQDKYSDFGTANTGLLGYGYKLNESWRATGSYSTAFRAPTFNDLYYPPYPGYQNNPNLQPERSHNAEVGIHYAASGQQVDVAYFNNNITDLITNTGTTVVNVNQASISGVELNYAGRFGNTGVKAAVTSQNPRDDATGQILLRRARFHSSLGVTQQLGNWQLGGEWLYSSSRQDNFYEPFSPYATIPETLASYNVFNLTGGYAFSKQLKLLARVDNLTNQNDSNIYGYNPLGRRLFASINYQP